MKPYLLIIIFAFSTLISCSSDAIKTSTSLSDEIAKSIITLEEKNYIIDDFINIGWKKNKKLDNSLFKSTQGIWYGFYNKRDVEVWIYNSHSDAIENSITYAEEAINKNPTNKDPTNPTEIRYHAYIVAGNALILCEDSLEDCKQLISKLK